MTNVLDKGHVELINWMGDDNTVVASARVSNLGESKGTEKDAQLIAYLIENRHTSPFEQVEFQFMVKCPIFVAREWMRHRTFNFNEVSRRYTSEGIDFHIPDSLRMQSNKNTQSSYGRVSGDDELIEMMKAQTNMAYDLYNLLLESGVCREQAREILPVNMYTSFYAKTDLHNLFHFLELRNNEKAQLEIRLYAQAIEKLIEPIVPISFQLWKENLDKRAKQ